MAFERPKGNNQCSSGMWTRKVRSTFKTSGTTLKEVARSMIRANSSPEAATHGQHRIGVEALGRPESGL